MLVAVDAGYFYACLIFDNDICIEAAPILKYCIGKDRNWCRKYFQRKRWKVKIVTLR